MDDPKQSDDLAAHDYYAYPPVEIKHPRRSRLRWMWLAALPLLACVGCLGLVLVFSPSLTTRFTDQQVPVTGGDPTGPAQQATAMPDPTSQPGSNLPSPMLPYGAELTNRLETCGSSFHDLYLLERVAANQPDMMQSDTWHNRAQDALQAFRQDCQKLGSMPSVPPAYKEIDHYLKLAAAEVKPAADSFHMVMDTQDPAALSTSLDHLVKFVEYTHKAETLLNGMQDRKQI